MTASSAAANDWASEPWTRVRKGLWIGGHHWRGDGSGALCTVTTPQISTAGFTTVLSLWDGPAAEPPAGCEHLRVPIPDGPLTDSQVEAVRSIAQRLAGQIRNGRRVLVRCHAGVNRAALVAVLTAVELDNTPAEDIISDLRERRHPMALSTAALADIIHARRPAQTNFLTDDDAAQKVYRKYQDQIIGGDPLAEMAYRWPELPTKVKKADPIVGWRVCAVIDTDDGPRLSAAFNAEHPAGIWHAPTMSASQVACQQPGPQRHPWIGCRCGLRLVQSWTVMSAFLRDQGRRMYPYLAVAEVEAWGRVMPGAPDDDWQHTARAPRMRIAGPLGIDPRVWHHRKALRRRYGVKTYRWGDGEGA